LPTTSAPRAFLARLVDLVCRRRVRVLIAWIVLLPAVIVLGARFGGDLSADYATPGSESKTAADLISERFPGSTGDTVDVAWRARTGVCQDLGSNLSFDPELAEQAQVAPRRAPIAPTQPKCLDDQVDEPLQCGRGRIEVLGTGIRRFPSLQPR
jgi:hypothetical protein